MNGFSLGKAGFSCRCRGQVEMASKGWGMWARRAGEGLVGPLSCGSWKAAVLQLLGMSEQWPQPQPPTSPAVPRRVSFGLRRVSSSAGVSESFLYKGASEFLS